MFAVVVPITTLVTVDRCFPTIVTVFPSTTLEGREEIEGARKKVPLFDAPPSLITVNVPLFAWTDAGIVADAVVPSSLAEKSVSTIGELAPETVSLNVAVTSELKFVPVKYTVSPLLANEGETDLIVGAHIGVIF